MPFPKYARKSLPVWMRQKPRPLETVHRYWFRASLIAVCCYTIVQKDVSIGLQFGSGGDRFPLFQWEQIRPQPASIAAAAEDNPGNTYSNMLYSSDGPGRTEKVRRQLAYVDAYGDLAVAEQKSYGIPVSITLAQGLLESNAGDSRLAQLNQNHFGIKCFSKTCGKGHCRNFEDDHHKDFFRIYGSVSESFRAHSKLLQANRYKALHKLDPNDYKGWAEGLQKAGYATDPAYAKKLIAIIEQLQLYKLDQ